MVYSDFPEAWPGLLDTIMGHLTSQVCTQLAVVLVKAAACEVVAWGSRVDGMRGTWLLCVYVRLFCPLPPPPLGCSCQGRVGRGACQSSHVGQVYVGSAFSLSLPRSHSFLQDQPRVYGGLLALRVLARKYEFKSDVSAPVEQSPNSSQMCS